MEPQVVTVGRIVMVNVAEERDKRPQTNLWRPAIVVQVWSADEQWAGTINAVAFLDGMNDHAYSGLVGSAVYPGALLKWITSAVHGFGPGEWSWPDELDVHLNSLDVQSRAIESDGQA